MADHGAEMELGIDGLSHFYGPCAGHKLVVQGGKTQIGVVCLVGEVFGAVVEDARMVPVAQFGSEAVDFIKRNPILYHIFVPVK